MVVIDWDVAKRWLGKLGAWVAFVAILALVRRDLNPTWAQVFWLVWPAVALFVILAASSYGIAHIKVWLMLRGGARTAGAPESAARAPPRSPAPASLWAPRPAIGRAVALPPRSSSSPASHRG